MDSVDRATRSRIMSSVNQKDTGPEILLRSALHKRGLRYRLHDRKLPGSPDLLLPRYRAAIFVHGCYWHDHGCYRSTKPKSRRDFWLEKFRANKERDARNLALLQQQGWRVLTVWECALVGKLAEPSAHIAEQVIDWLNSDQEVGEIPFAHEDFSRIRLQST